MPQGKHAPSNAIASVAEPHRGRGRTGIVPMETDKDDRATTRAPVDAARDRGVIARVGPARGVQPGSAFDPREVDLVAGALGKLLQILELRAAVALAERVDMVDVPQHRTRALGEAVRPRAPEEPCHHNAPVNVGHAGGNAPPRLEPALALGDLDGADLARPRVDVLEQVVVDRLQVDEVEIARRHRLKKALGDKLAFRCLQRRGGPDVQPVAENGVVGRIAVIAVAHSAAATRPRRRTIWARRRSGDHPSRSNIRNMTISSAVRGLPSIACKCAASASRPFAENVAAELESCCILDMVGPYHIAPVKATGGHAKQRIAANRNIVRGSNHGHSVTRKTMQTALGPVHGGRHFRVSHVGR